MPVKTCSKDGKSGYKYGDSGHCYTGPGAKRKAAKQGQAIEISRHKKGTANVFDNFFEPIDFVDAVVRSSVDMTEEEFAAFADSKNVQILDSHGTIVAGKLDGDVKLQLLYPKDQLQNIVVWPLEDNNEEEKITN